MERTAKRVLVTGSNGFLGRRISKLSPEDVEIIGSGRQGVPATQGIEYRRLDIRWRDDVVRAVEELKPDWVINAAALTDVDLCETERKLAWQVNVEGADNVAQACERVGSGLIHISSDYVFDGRDGPYDEEDVPNPLGYYGLTKLESERRVLGSSAKAVVVRTMVLFGYEPGVHLNFATWVAKMLYRGRGILVVTDQWGNPTFADDLAQVLMRFPFVETTGLFHFAGADFLTRYEMALKVAEVFSLNASLIRPISTEELEQVALRPLRSGLRTDKIERELKIKPGGFERGLRRMAEQIGSLRDLVTGRLVTGCITEIR